MGVVPQQSWWCTRGGMVTVVEAGFEDRARTLAKRAFGVSLFRPDEDVLIDIREATSADLALWAVLVAQDTRGVDGARCVPSPDLPSIEAPSLFGGGS